MTSPTYTRAMCEKTVVYDDFGVSRGMQYGIDHAEALGHPVVWRQLPEDLALIARVILDESAVTNGSRKPTPSSGKTAKSEN